MDQVHCKEPTSVCARPRTIQFQLGAVRAMNCERVRTHGCPLLSSQMVSCQWEFLNWAKQNGQRMRWTQQVARENTKLGLHANSPLARRTESHTFNWRHFTCSPASNVSQCRAEAGTERFTTIASLTWARAGSISNRKQCADQGCPYYGIILATLCKFRTINWTKQKASKHERTFSLSLCSDGN